MSTLPTSMNEFMELLKQIALIFGVVAPAAKLLLGWAGSPKNLEERYSRIERFFSQGGEELTPLLREAAMGAALGHLKLSAVEIAISIKEREPTRFIERYLQVRPYLSPNVEGTMFVLKSAAASPFWRNVVRSVSFFFYATFAASAGWLALFGVPELLVSSKWLPAVGGSVLSILFGWAAWLSIVEGRRITWAIQLHAAQHAT